MRQSETTQHVVPETKDKEVLVLMVPMRNAILWKLNRSFHVVMLDQLCQNVKNDLKYLKTLDEYERENDQKQIFLRWKRCAAFIIK